MRHLVTILLSICLLHTSKAAEVVTTGLTGELKQTMDELLQPRLEYIKQRPATEWRADDAAYFLKSLLIKQGYAESNITWKISNNTITLHTNLGTQFTIGNISANSTKAISPQLLDDYFTQPIISREAVKRSQAPYLAEYPAEGAANVANYLKSLGYWDATAKIASTQKLKNGKVNIKLAINSGSIHQILKPTFTGVSPEHYKLLYPKLIHFVGKPATTANISQLNQLIHQFYRDNGYQFAKILATPTNVTTGPPGILVTFNVKSDNQYRVRNILVKGQQQTLPHKIRRYANSLKNKNYDRETANKIAKKLIQTEAFETVRLKPNKINDSQLDLEIIVKETKAKFFKTYTGLDTYDGFILGASYTDQNFLKKLKTFSVKSEISNRGLLGAISLTEPFFAGVSVTQNTRLYALQRKSDGYKKTLTGIEESFSWAPTDHYSMKLAGAFDIVGVTASGLTDAELGPTSYINTRVSFQQELDFRDSHILPTHGFHALWLLEQGAVNGDASTTYFRTDLNTSYRHTFKNNRRLMASFDAGAIFPADSADLPIDLRLFSGGADSVRSFAERELGPLGTSNDPLGGQSYWNATIEYIQPFNEFFSGVLFLDSGQVFSTASDFNFNNPSHAAGLGLRIELPVGPARFEYGFNLNQQTGEPSGAFHFSLGAQF